MVVSFFSPLTLVETSIGHMRFSALSFSGTSSVGIAAPCIFTAPRQTAVRVNRLGVCAPTSFQDVKFLGGIGGAILDVHSHGLQGVANRSQSIVAGGLMLAFDLLSQDRLDQVH